MCIDLLAWKEASYLTDAYSAHNMYTVNLAFQASKDVQSVEEKSTQSLHIISYYIIVYYNISYHISYHIII